MIKTNFISSTVDRDGCIKIVADMKASDYYGVSFIKKHRLTIAEFEAIEDMVKEFWYKGNTGCFQDKIANVFRRYGFTVCPDKHNVMFHIY